MKIAFSICDNNYLDKAKVFFDSLIQHNPDYHCILFLSDKKKADIDYSRLHAEVVEVDQVGIPGFDDFNLKYTIVEFSTAIKPFIFDYIWHKYKEVDLTIYFDPDIKIYSNLKPIEDELTDKSVLLTPHCLSPVPLTTVPFENTFLNYGIYNLGFIAVKNNAESHTFMNWWKERTYNFCYDNVCQGFFVDQHFISIAPLFFPFIKISRHMGMNVAYWNLYERKISFTGDAWVINNEFPLIFFHFSSFDSSINYVTKRGSSFTWNDNPEAKPLFSEYGDDILKNSFYKIKTANFYISRRNEYLEKNRKALRNSTGKLKAAYALTQVVPTPAFRKMHNILSYMKKVNIKYKKV